MKKLYKTLLIIFSLFFFTSCEDKNVIHPFATTIVSLDNYIYDFDNESLKLCVNINNTGDYDVTDIKLSISIYYSLSTLKKYTATINDRIYSNQSEDYNIGFSNCDMTYLKQYSDELIGIKVKITEISVYTDKELATDGGEYIIKNPLSDDERSSIMKEANELFNQKKYSEALSKYTRVRGYSISQERIDICKKGIEYELFLEKVKMNVTDNILVFDIETYSSNQIKSISYSNSSHTAYCFNYTVDDTNRPYLYAVAIYSLLCRGYKTTDNEYFVNSNGYACYLSPVDLTNYTSFSMNYFTI